MAQDNHLGGGGGGDDLAKAKQEKQRITERGQRLGLRRRRSVSFFSVFNYVFQFIISKNHSGEGPSRMPRFFFYPEEEDVSHGVVRR